MRDCDEFLVYELTRFPERFEGVIDALAGGIVSFGIAADSYYPDADENDKSCPNCPKSRPRRHSYHGWVEGLHSEFNVRCQCYSIWEIGILEEMNIRTVLRFTVVGIVVGLVLGWLISLVSGNIFIVLAGGALGTLVGLVLGVIHRNDR